MPDINLDLLDFDGVLTPRDGRSIVYSDEYRAVCTTPDMLDEIKSEQDKADTELQENIANYLGDLIPDIIDGLAVIPELSIFTAEEIKQLHQTRLEKLLSNITKLLSEKDEIIRQWEESDLPEKEYDEVSGMENKVWREPYPYEANNAKHALHMLHAEVSDLLKQKAEIAKLEIHTIREKTRIEYNVMKNIYVETEDTNEAILTRTRQILMNIKESYSTHPDFIMPDDAKLYLHNNLQNPDYVPHIISKNHQEFIQAILLHNGFSDTEVSRITIWDLRKGASDKKIVATDIIEKSKEDGLTIASLTICDDNPGDSDAMTHAAILCQINPDIINSVCEAPGTFDFVQIANATRMLASTAAEFSLHRFHAPAKDEPSNEEIVAHQKTPGGLTPKLGSKD
jgi:ElaB/YqjD/DUF883 family membrane-anchored ribosome-binding protein